LLFLFVCSACLILGCESRNAHPEMMDPVYLELKAEIGVAEGELKGILADTTLKRGKVSEQNESWRGKQKLWIEYYKALRLETVALERVQYLNTKLESRQMEDRLNYNAAINNGKVWPNPKEIVFYRRNRIHRTISSDWKRARPELEKLARGSSQPPSPPAH
jgi:hypothetical protein